MPLPFTNWLRCAVFGALTTVLLSPAMAQHAAPPTIIDPAATDPTYAARKAALSSQLRPAIALPTSSAGAAAPAALVALPGCFEAADTVSTPANGGFTMLARGDDTSTGAIALGFSFSLYGTAYTSCYVNMNGTVSFGAADVVYSPTGFPYATPMVAPFWGDVDTRGANSGHVWYKVYADRLVVLWNHVGFYNNNSTGNTPLKNTFEVIIRANTTAPRPSPDVTFAYGNMNWTTGTASNGVAGFAGTPATVGINPSANATNYIQTGRFNLNDYTAPLASYPATTTNFSGVHWLDGQCIGYTVTAAGNQAPIATNLPDNNTVTLYQGQTVSITPQFMAPEGNQTTTVTTNLNGLCSATAVSNGAASPIVTFTVTGNPCNLGTNTVTFTATDNGAPVASSTTTLTVIVLPPPGNALAFNGTSNYVTIPHNAAFDITGAISLEAWVRTSATTEQYITTKTEDSWYLAVNGAGAAAGRASFYLNGPSNAAGWLYGTTSIADGHWHHVAGTYDGATLKIFVDGVLQNSRAATGSIATGTNAVLIGARPINKWNGTIDEVRVWNTDRSSQLDADMRTVPTLPQTGLVAYYSFDQGTAGGNNAGLTSLTELVGGYTGTLTGPFTLTGTTSNWVESYALVVPTATAATGIGATGFAANWTASAVGTTDSYRLDVSTNATFTAPITGSPFTVAGGTLSRSFTGLTANTTYYYRMRATKASLADVGDYSATIAVPTCPLPTAIARNLTLSLDASGSATALATAVNNSSTPTACGTLTYALLKGTVITATLTGTVAEGGTLTMTAPNGGTFTGVTFASYGTPIDNGNGTFSTSTCHSSTSQSIVSNALVGNTTGSIVANNATFVDPCVGTVKRLTVQATYTYTTYAPALASASYGCSEVGSANPVRLVVTDANGNSSTANATITIVDNLAPTAVAQNISLDLNIGGTATPTAAAVNNGSTDNCAVQTAELLSGVENITNGTFNTNITGWTATNVDGNGGYRDPGGNPGGTFVLNDNGNASTDPTLTQTVTGLTVGATYLLRGSYENYYGTGTVGTQAFAVDLNGSQLATFPNPGVVWTPFMLRFTATAASQTLAFRGEIGTTDIDIAIDNISLVQFNPTYTCTNVGANPVTLLLTDPSGNQSMATATVTVTVPTTATTTTWNGSTSTDPQDCRNWSYGKVPDTATNAVIPAGLSTYPALTTGTLSVANISIATANGLSVGSGATLQVSGNFANTTAVALAGTVSFTGSAATQTLTSAAGTTFAKLTVNKAVGTVQLGSDVAVTGALTLTNGTLTTGTAYKVALGTTGTISESNASYVIGAVEATRNLNTTAANTFGGLGLTLTPSGTTLPGNTLVRRVTGSPVTGAASRQGVGRYFTITPTTNTGLNVAMAFSYFDHELNGIAATSLSMYRGANATTTTWARQTASTRTGNVVTRAGLTTLADTYTLGSLSAPLPVELTAFTATAQDAHTVALAWTTASEKNSDRFEVERSLNATDFARIATVAAQGTTTAPTAYAQLDAKLPAGALVLYYRLRQVDADGTAAYSPVQAVKLPTTTATLALYPNPAHTSATLLGATPGTAVQVLDALGRSVATATADATGTAALALPAGLPAGVYLVRSGTQATRLTVE